jgi:hypothetical protein
VIWLNPLALVALALVSAPLLIHLLVQRHAERFPFPTLRFLQPTRLAAIRRHLLEDIPLLLVRAAILAAAAAALAGPLLVTAARRQAWDTRLVRAVVVDDAGGARSLAEAPEARRREPSDAGDPERVALHATRDFEASGDLSDGIRRAVSWLESAPPARREIVIASPLPIGSITAADIAAIPADIGIRFERSGALPSSRTIPFGRIVTTNGEIDREVTLAGPQTLVREVPTTSASRTPWPVEVIAPPVAKPTVDAAIAAVRSQRVLAPVADRRARLMLLSVNDGQSLTPIALAVEPVRVPWIADAVARITRDTDLQSAASRLPRGIADASYTRAPWHVVAVAADGAPVVVAAASPDQLLLASGAPASDLVTPLLMRSIANALAPVPDVTRAEVVPIADTVLREWARSPAAPATPRLDTVDQDDRRWFWIAALGLLAVEAWMRRAKTRLVDEEEGSARVA